MLNICDDHGRSPSDLHDVRVLLTAEEAFPAMERAFLEAEREIWAGYRVFDLSTRLRTEEARKIGDTWFDLIVHVLERGVALNFILSDFDPILAPDLHEASWKARRAFIAAREVAGPDARLHVVNATHSARVGILPRVLLWPRLIKQCSQIARDLNRMDPMDRALKLESSPGLRPWLTVLPGGHLAARRWPPPPLVPGTHHQKIAVFDGDLLCVGGLDLDERRYDDKGHHRRRDETWHDVQLMCRGTVADDAQRHLETFLGVVAGDDPPAGCGSLMRTLSRRRRIEAPFLGPKPLVREIYDAHLQMIGDASELIYLETQFFRDRRIAGALARAARRKPDLGLIMVLPAAPEDVAFDGATSSDARFGEHLQARCVAEVAEAFEERAAICSPVRPERIKADGRDILCNSPIIYVHAKVSIFDEQSAIVSSANLNGRSMSWDTEAGVALWRWKDVSGLRERVMRHWLGKNAPVSYFDTQSAVSSWRKRIRDNARRDPERREGFLVPYQNSPAKAFGSRPPLVPESMV